MSTPLRSTWRTTPVLGMSTPMAGTSRTTPVTDMARLLAILKDANAPITAIRRRIRRRRTVGMGRPFF
ncbi:hypothetical protein BE11_22925 [Sorangium cellulosum]|nr:hypothetical protein BE11_22925 [Sorangium cellulosum]